MQWHFLRAVRGVEFKAGGAERRFELPGKVDAVTRVFGYVAAGDGQAARQGLFALTQPELPVDIILTQGVMITALTVQCVAADQQG